MAAELIHGMIGGFFLGRVFSHLDWNKCKWKEVAWSSDIAYEIFGIRSWNLGLLYVLLKRKKSDLALNLGCYLT